MIKKFFVVVILTTFLATLVPLEAYADDDGYFIVTAYYSPLPNQQYYLKGNYEAEIRLNGQWIAGASGKKVFSGMLAAPWKYNFGTKIYLEWLGIGEVADRWWAIVEAGQRGYNYDRIDVWMGYGDEWLRRALYWGKRKVKWSVISAQSQVNLDYSSVPAPTWATNNLQKVSNIFHIPLWVWSNPTNIKELQKILHETGLYKWNIDGIYNDEVIDVVYNFQLENDIVKNSYEYGAWYWGTNTRNTFFKKYINGELTNTPSVEDDSSLQDIFEWPIENETDVKNLQDILKKLAVYDGEINGDYISIKSIILKYQLSREVISHENEIGAGNFWPKTRAKLKEEYQDYLDFEQRKSELMEIYEDLESESIQEASEIVKSIGTPVYGNIDSNVRELQKWLNKIGYFDYKDTAIFWVKTKNSIIDFQIDNQIITSSLDTWAGVFGPQTKEYFEKEISHLLLQEKLVEAGIFEEIQTTLKEDNKREELGKSSLLENSILL